MCSTTVDQIDNKRDLSFTIMKAMAAIFVVASQAGGPSWWMNLSSLLGMPVLFICAGYFFQNAALQTPKTYLWKRISRIYSPFWAWSISFLVLHNLFTWIGFLPSNQYYDWQEFFQNLWSITFNMSGYDPILCGTFWFFRALFIAGIVFFGLFYVIPQLSRWKTPVSVACTIFMLAFGLALWQTWADLNITGVAQGGYRELIALLLMSAGYLYRLYQKRFSSKWIFGIAGMLVLAFFLVVSPSSMTSTADVFEFLSLPLAAFGAFLTLRMLSLFILEKIASVTKVLTYVGDRMLYVLAFHLLAFKVVSVFKVLFYGLSWSYVGRDYVVGYSSEDWFFLLYWGVGVTLPLLVVKVWKMMDTHYNLTWYNCLKYTGQGLFALFLFVCHLFKRVGIAFWKSVKGFFSDMKGFIKASNPKDE